MHAPRNASIKHHVNEMVSEIAPKHSEGNTIVIDSLSSDDCIKELALLSRSTRSGVK